MKKALPIGVENFEDMVKSGYYYVDKTLFIKELLDLKGKVNLFTRPRRFGKTLNLSMLRYFFEDSGDMEKNRQNRELFRGMKILDAGERFKKTVGLCPGLFCLTGLCGGAICSCHVIWLDDTAHKLLLSCNKTVAENIC